MLILVCGCSTTTETPYNVVSEPQPQVRAVYFDKVLECESNARLYYEALNENISKFVIKAQTLHCISEYCKQHNMITYVNTDKPLIDVDWPYIAWCVSEEKCFEKGGVITDGFVGYGDTFCTKV